MTTELESNVALPPEETKKKPRARRAKKVEQSETAASLIAALKFVSVAQKKIGTTTQQFCAISGNWIAASNGVLMAGAKVEEDLTACPHTFQLIDALAKCGQELNITQLSENTLSIKSDKFKAQIPCALLHELELTAPDENIAVIDDRIKAALENVACLASDTAPNAIHAAIFLTEGSAVATNGFAILEYWHGLNLPPMLLPKASAAAIVKAPGSLVGLGYSGPSATFWFDNGSFIKTQLYGERFPHYQGVFEASVDPWPLPDEFFKAVHAVESFSKNGVVYFDNGVISSRESQEEATTYIVEGLPDNMAFQAKYLISLEHAFKKAHFDLDGNKVYCFGENIRGVLMAIDLKRQPVDNTEEDDIPF